MDNMQSYWDGSKNRIIRYYYYIQKGLALLNEFRYLLMSIFAAYYALKIDNIWIIPLMFIISLPILLILGWCSLHHMDKVIEFLQIKHATHWAKYNIHLQEEQMRLLKKISENTSNE